MSDFLVDVLHGFADGGPPTHMLFTRGSHWETANRLEPADAAAAVAPSPTWIPDDPADEPAAGEIFFVDPAGIPLFLGFRDPREGGADRMLAALHRCAGGRPDPRLLDTLRSILGEVGRGPPDFADLGILDHWLSLDASRIWTAGELSDFERVRTKLAERTDLHRSRRQTPVLEFGWTLPFEHWVGIGVARQYDGEWRLDWDLLASWWGVLTRFLASEP